MSAQKQETSKESQQKGVRFKFDTELEKCIDYLFYTKNSRNFSKEQIRADIELFRKAYAQNFGVEPVYIAVVDDNEQEQERN